MHTPSIEFTITTNVRDVIGYPTALEVCGKAFADHISSMLLDIRDPKTGESPRLVCTYAAARIQLSLRGSEWCLAEAHIRLLAMLQTNAAGASA